MIIEVDLPDEYRAELDAAFGGADGLRAALVRFAYAGVEAQIDAHTNAQRQEAVAAARDAFGLVEPEPPPRTSPRELGRRRMIERGITPEG